MRTNAIIRIVIFSLVIFILLGILAVGLGIGMFIFRVDSGYSGTYSGTQASSGEVSAAEVQNLNIEWVNGSITIQPGDTDTITFAETGNFSDNEQLVWQQSGNTLTIQFSKPRVSFGIEFDGSKDLVITVPQDWQCEELDINSVSAKIEVSNLTAYEIDLENVSGNCIFENCGTNELTVETVSGNVTYDGTLYTMDCSTVSANCTLKTNACPRELSLDSVSGDLILELPEECGFSASIDSMSGSISSEFESTATKDYHTHGDGSCRITADTLSGDIIIRKS